MAGFLTRVPNGVPGAITRDADKLVEPQIILDGLPPLAYGDPIAIDSATGKVRRIVANETSTVYGIVTRPFPTNSGSSYNGALLTAIPPATGTIDVLKRGYISVKVYGAAEPQKNGLVYVRIIATSATQVVGGFEAASDGVNTLTLSGDTYFMGARDDKGTAEIHFMALLSSSAGAGEVNQVLGTAGNITVSPNTAGAPAYTVDLATITTAGSFNYPSINTDNKGRIISATSNSPVTTFGIGINGRTGDIRVAGSNSVSITENPNNTYTFTSTGGSGLFTGSAVWTGGTATKNAYNADGSINVQGITVTLVASLALATDSFNNILVYLNGQIATGAYNSTGSFPTYTITVPSANIASLSGQTDPSVNITLTGNFGSSSVNLSNVAMLSNVQRQAFNAIFSAAYTVDSLPFYQQTATLAYQYTAVTGTINGNGYLVNLNPIGSTLTLNATMPSGSFANQAIDGGSISGSIIGTGLDGAGVLTIPVSGSFTKVNSYIPAFYAQSANSTPPIFTTGSLQTQGADIGSRITYPVATAASQYNWIATQRPLANILFVTPLGNTPLVPDVTGFPQTIGSRTFSIYGFTRLGVGTASQLVIT